MRESKDLYKRLQGIYSIIEHKLRIDEKNKTLHKLLQFDDSANSEPLVFEEMKYARRSTAAAAKRRAGGSGKEKEKEKENEQDSVNNNNNNNNRATDTSRALRRCVEHLGKLLYSLKSAPSEELGGQQ